MTMIYYWTKKTNEKIGFYDVFVLSLNVLGKCEMEIVTGSLMPFSPILDKFTHFYDKSQVAILVRKFLDNISVAFSATHSQDGNAQELSAEKNIGFNDFIISGLDVSVIKLFNKNVKYLSLIRLFIYPSLWRHIKDEADLFIFPLFKTFIYS